MEQSVTYIIPGLPIAWRRAGYGGHFYDTQKGQKLVSGISMKQQHANRPQFTGPLELIITFFFPLPKISKPKQALLSGNWFTNRPDGDNLEKFILDAATNVLFHDGATYSLVW